ncbi:tRNA wybutosine-synthesizing protein 3 homolog isoform X3 [Brachyistius frenatus]|uniref:tRNA wybutosine-synthesizing protein 3 homolog isoform X3 n=1 Tax=Brachyistius frenatus TaxID=100188 RepID=UPI0037E87F4D
MEKRFSQRKQQCLNKLDVSKKGSVDEGIQHVVCLLNRREEYFTTSSCSGRVILIDGGPERSHVQKKNCVWLFVTHHKCTSDDLICGVARSTGNSVLKFEPFVLHVQCRNLENAQLMAVRSTHGLEVPLTHEGKLLVEHEYIHFLTQTVNQMMEENIRRIHRFYQNLQSALLTDKLQKLQIPDPPCSQGLQDPPPTQEIEQEERNKTSVYKWRRKREQHQTDCYHGDGDSSVPELEDCLDLFS